MKKLLAITQLAGAILFLAMFLTTIFGLDHIKELSRDFLNTKLEDSSAKSVVFAEQALASELSKKYLTQEQIKTFNAEIELYYENPKDYIESLTTDTKEIAKANLEQSDLLNPKLKSLAEKVFSWKVKIKEHFNKMFMKIIIDLRIFSLSNVAGFALSYWLLRHGMGKDKRFIAGSVILTASVLFQAMMYVDQNWFFTILFNSFMGLGHPISIAVTFGWLMYEYQKNKKTECNHEVQHKVTQVSE